MTEEIGRRFLEGTRYRNQPPSGQKRGAPAPTASWPVAAEETPVALPAHDAACRSDPSLPSLLARRASLREYAEGALPAEVLSWWLWACQGVRDHREDGSTLRTAPSAGARHPFETLLWVRRVADVEAGLYRYDSHAHRLLRRPDAPGREAAIVAACFDRPFVASAPVLFFWAAVPERASHLFGQRGYRYLFLDAGHLCENLYLAAEAVGGGVCAVGGFHEPEIDEALGLSATEATTLYGAAAGLRP